MVQELAVVEVVMLVMLVDILSAGLYDDYCSLLSYITIITILALTSMALDSTVSSRALDSTVNMALEAAWHWIARLHVPHSCNAWVIHAMVDTGSVQGADTIGGASACSAHIVGGASACRADNIGGAIRYYPVVVLRTWVCDLRECHGLWKLTSSCCYAIYFHMRICLKLHTGVWCGTLS
jgi:hypothetical protein